jgi:hypothetical protein
MTDPRPPRAIVGRALLGSALVMIVLAALFGAGLIPLEPGARPLVAGVMALVAVADALIGFWFLRRTP